MRDELPGLPPDLDAWRAAYRQVSDPGGEACPSDEVLAELLLGGPPDPVRTELADHLVGCRHCRDRFRLLGELHREAESARVGSPATSWRRWAGLAAAVALVGVVVVQLLVGPAGRDDPVRGGEVAMAVEPPPGSRLGAPPAALSWSALESVQGYRVRLFDAGGELIWEAEIEGTAAQLPPEVRSVLVGGESYFWVVDSAPDGERLGPYWFELGP